MTPPANPLRWLFVCTGNLCRSPMAAALATELAYEQGLAPEIRSRGTSAVVGSPATARAIAVCRELGVPLDNHRATQLEPDDLLWADVVFVMEEHHALVAVDLAPDCAERIVRLGPLAGEVGIEDPYGSWTLGPYRTARDRLITAIRRYLTGPARPTRP